MRCVVHSLDSMPEEQPLLRIMASTRLADEAFQSLVEQLEDAAGGPTSLMLGKGITFTGSQYLSSPTSPINQWRVAVQIPARQQHRVGGGRFGK